MLFIYKKQAIKPYLQKKSVTKRGGIRSCSNCHDQYNNLLTLLELGVNLEARKYFIDSKAIPSLPFGYMLKKATRI